MRPTTYVLRIARLGVAIALIAAATVMVPTTADAAGNTVAIAATSSGTYRLEADGSVIGSGTTSLGNANVGRPTAIAATPSGLGYWVTGAGGAVDAFGDAADHGDLSHLQLAGDIIAMAPTQSGDGYWLVGSDGGVFSFGSARFLGSMGGVHLAQPVVGIASSPTGNGYWLLGGDGGVFAFGDAKFLGSMGWITLDQPVIGMSRAPAGNGYFMVAADGGVFTFGDAPFLGSIGGQGRTDIAALSPTPSGNGYVVVSRSGQVISFGDAATGGTTTSGNDLLDRINAERVLRGAAPLRWDPELAEVANAWSHTMSRSSLHHSDLDAVIVGLDTQHVALGENIYWGSEFTANTASAHVWFMGSTGHRSTMLDPAYTVAGIGVACVDGNIWVTELFGRPATDGRATYAGTAPALPKADLSAIAAPSC